MIAIPSRGCFIGADTPMIDMIQLIQELPPDLAQTLVEGWKVVAARLSVNEAKS